MDGFGWESSYCLWKGLALAHMQQGGALVYLGDLSFGS
jgi:hypothetical protein